MTERCKNPLDKVLSYTSLVSLYNERLSGPSPIYNQDLILMNTVATDLDYADNKPDGKTPAANLLVRLEQLQKSPYARADISGLIQSLSSQPPDTLIEINGDIIGPMMPPIIQSIIALDVARQEEPCTLASQRHHDVSPSAYLPTRKIKAQPER